MNTVRDIPIRRVRPPKIKRPKAPAPNHFFAVRISDCQIVQTVNNVHNTILEQEPRLKTALVSPSTLHITLAVAHLSTSEDVVKANQVLQESVGLFSARLPNSQLDIDLAQMGHFNNKVIYARIKEESDGAEYLNHLWKSLRDGCQTAGISLIDGDRFTPHVTLLKISKDPRLRRKGIKAVASHLYEKHVDCVFGRQVVESVQLLSMTDPKDDEGYYALKGEFHFGTIIKPLELIDEVDVETCTTSSIAGNHDVSATCDSSNSVRE
ncbi:A-kinase anchor protein 7-like [Daphnia carinata]|uniref:A-kinase anchor protein 7-like n=1 Tax=Daphnia carinata TaxID=120202 RepID=UPI00257EDC4D|nr:A-kinase anchor protein 7-like [Daphnia carinata]XP_059353575.1 A-kinase anchor protein 7-like [Daphnia carinata]